MPLTEGGVLMPHSLESCPLPMEAANQHKLLVRSRTEEYGKLLFLCWTGGLILSLYLAALPLDLHAQLATAAAFLSLLIPLLSYSLGVGRVFFLFLVAFLPLRFFLWRTFHTLSYHYLLSFIAALAVYSAEAYSLCIHLLGLFVNIFPLNRQPIPLPTDPQQIPTVDVFIPSYNESADLLEVTLLAAMQ